MFEPPKNPYPFLSHYTVEHTKHEAFKRGVEDTIKTIEEYLGCSIEDAYMRLHPPRKRVKDWLIKPADIPSSTGTISGEEHQILLTESLEKHKEIWEKLGESLNVERGKGMKPFEHELASLLNRYSKENGSNTPDSVLAQYLVNCLLAFDYAVTRRDLWYGENHSQPIGVKEMEEIYAK